MAPLRSSREKRQAGAGQRVHARGGHALVLLAEEEEDWGGGGGGLDQQELGQVDWTGKLQVRLLCFIFLLCFLLFNILPLFKIQNNFKIVTKPFE